MSAEQLLEQPIEAPSRARWTALGVGVAFDLALNGQRPGLSIPLLVLVAAASVRPFLRSGGVETDVLLGVAVVFSVFPALRANDGLIAADVLVVIACFALAATHDARGVARSTVEALLRRGFHVTASMLRVPVAMLAPLARAAGRMPLGRVRPWLRGGLIALPILIVFAALLASADRVFGELLVPSLPEVDLGGVGSHAALTIVGAFGVGVLWLAAARPVPEAIIEARPLPKVEPAEWLTVLAGIDLLFAAFVGVQFAVLFGGSAQVEVTPGLTYAEYARSGFFQLIAVAALTAIVILGGWDLGRRTAAREERVFRGLVSIMVALTGVILASALMRLALYEQAFGFTLNRLAAYVVIGWIGAVLLILAGAIWRGARDRVVALALTAALCALLVVNVMNPERFVAERNAARFAATGKVDVAYLGSLGLDAVPAATALLPELSHAEAATLRNALCARAELLEDDPGWRSANLARARAESALADVCA